MLVGGVSVSPTHAGLELALMVARLVIFHGLIPTNNFIAIFYNKYKSTVGLQFHLDGDSQWPPINGQNPF